MKLISSVSVSLCVFFLVLFCLVFVVKGKGDDANTLLVDSDNSVNVKGAECGKESVEQCKEGSGGTEESSFESEDYIYTQSLP
ncbi:unnamed protein product [Camellia sinensis]